MGEAVQRGGRDAAIRLERGNAADAWGPRLARGTEGHVPRLAFAWPPRRSFVAAAAIREPDAEISCELPAREKAAFTLRLDPVRHARLKTACATSSRSAQQVVTQALDAFLAAATGGPALAPSPARAPIRTGGF